MNRLSLNVLTSRIAIGSLCLVAGFLATCGFYNMFPFIESLAGTKTWSTLVALPVIVFSYAIGSVVMLLSNVFPSSPEERASDLRRFVEFAGKAADPVIARYESLSHEREFVLALFPTMALLGCSVIWSAYRVLTGTLANVAILAGLATILAAPLFRILANRIAVDMSVLAETPEILVEKAQQSDQLSGQSRAET